MIDDEKIKLEFGRLLKKQRLVVGLSQESLAHLCDLDRTYIGGVERGERNVSLINIIKVAEALGVQPSELMPTLKLKGNV